MAYIRWSRSRKGKKKNLCVLIFGYNGFSLLLCFIAGFWCCYWLFKAFLLLYCFIKGFCCYFCLSFSIYMRACVLLIIVVICWAFRLRNCIFINSYYMAFVTSVNSCLWLFLFNCLVMALFEQSSNWALSFSYLELSGGFNFQQKFYILCCIILI